MLCAIYVRLSKEDEDKHQIESESIQNQKSLLTNYAVDHGWDIYAIYCDEDYSGADSLRPDFNRMLAAAKAKKFQIILCKSQSRFTRDMELVEKYIHGLFPIWGIRFIAVADNADTEVKGNKKARQINGLVNEWYLEDLSENVRMVFDLKRREGQYIGGFPIYGYQKDPANKNHIIIDPEAAEVVRQIFQWSLEGHGKQNIAHMLNGQGVPSPSKYKAERGWTCNHPTKNDYGLWNKTTIWRILHNEMYTGTMVQGRRKKVSYKSKVLIDVPEDQWYRVEGTHEPIIDRETFDAVQRNLALHTKTDGSGEVHLLSGMVKCMDCGSTMSKVTNCKQGRPRVSYLRCKLYADSGKAKLCSRHSIRLDKLEELVSDRIRYYVQTYYKLEPLDIQPKRDARREALEQERKSLTAQMEKRSQALKTLYLDKVSGILTDGQFTELNQSFLEEKSHLEQRLAKIDSELADQEKPQQQDDLMERAKELLKLETVPRELVVALVDQIEIGERNPDTGEQQVRITWKF
ncbi:recombinase family protein [uncultured Oscillibacter sp.]|uniref:recombinase family protein n=1 Tax=uncultured Oscillibacter sp. TaxID=876091 RepID=UPI0026094705|nr:recombinase family protein [uncultured Oscillibacter sp.]